MGRLPSEWAGRVIMDRVPYTISGELVISSDEASLQFPDNTFSNNTDKPFEIHRVIPRLVGVDDAGVVQTNQPDQDTLGELVRLNINDLGLNQIITKNPTLISLLTKGSSERTWEWADPHYLTRGNQIQVTATSLPLTAFAAVFDELRIGLAFQGFLLVVAPPSENR